MPITATRKHNFSSFSSYHRKNFAALFLLFVVNKSVKAPRISVILIGSCIASLGKPLRVAGAVSDTASSGVHMNTVSIMYSWLSYTSVFLVLGGRCLATYKYDQSQTRNYTTDVREVFIVSYTCRRSRHCLLFVAICLS